MPGRSHFAGELLFPLLAAVLGVAIVGAGVRQSIPVLADLALSETAAQDGFFNSVWDAYPAIPGGQQAFKAASPAQRAAMVRGLGSFLKAYTQTAGFRQRYAAAREASRPRPREPQKSLSEIDRDADASLAEMEASLESLPPDLRQQLEQSLKELKAHQAEQRKDTKMRARMEDSLRAQSAQDAQRHEEAVRAYETKFPANSDELIARRLRTFLEVSATVDFDAKLVKQGSQLRFANTEYEASPPEWKLCYRAGREATEAARAFAVEWLKSMPPER